MIGCGTTVGRPLGLMRTCPTEHATVTMVDEATIDVAAHTRVADVVVAAAGVAHLVQPYWVKPGATVLSVGITRAVEGILGDVHPDVGRVAGKWSRATGGVGPMTRAMLLRNVSSFPSGQLVSAQVREQDPEPSIETKQGFGLRLLSGVSAVDHQRRVGVETDFVAGWNATAAAISSR